MKQLLGWFALVRPLNLMLIALTPLALWLSLIIPLYEEPELTARQVWWLGVAIAVVAGAGNVVNNIADRTIDDLNNRPNPLLGGVRVGEAWAIYAALNLGAAAISVKLATEVDWYAGLVMLPLAVGLLLAYAFWLKCQPVIGNVVVAVLCAGVPGLILVVEPGLLGGLPDHPNAHAMLAYVVFAFAGTMMRETIKDLQDVHGDGMAGCRTLAVRLPAARVQAFANAWGFVALAAISYIGFVYFRSESTMAAMGWGLVWLFMAVAIWNVDVPRPDLRNTYAFVSRQLKWTLALALLILVLYGRTSWNSGAL